MKVYFQKTSFMTCLGKRNPFSQSFYDLPGWVGRGRRDGLIWRNCDDYDASDNYWYSLNKYLEFKQND